MLCSSLRQGMTTETVRASASPAIALSLAKFQARKMRRPWT